MISVKVMSMTCCDRTLLSRQNATQLLKFLWRVGPGIASHGKHSLKGAEHSSGLRSELGIQWRIYWWILHYREVDLSCQFASIYSRFIDDFWKIISDSGETYINRFRISLRSFLNFAPFWARALPLSPLSVPIPSVRSQRIRNQFVLWDQLASTRGRNQHWKGCKMIF